MNMVQLGALATLGLSLILPLDLAAQGRSPGHDKQEQREEQKERQERQDRPDRDRAERMETARVDAREVRRDRREADRPRVAAPVMERIVIRDDTGRLLYRDRGREILLLERDVDERFRVRDSEGPAFCRSGDGHPVHGRSWCLEKGFGLGQTGEFFFDGDDTVYYHDGDEVVVVRDSRLDRDRSLWKRVVNAVLFWRD